MDIDDAVSKGLDEIGREKPHIAGETYEIDSSFFQCRDDLGIVLRPFSAVFLDNKCLDASSCRLRQTGSVPLIADHNNDLGVRYFAGRDRVDQRHHVRPAAGNENTDLHNLKELQRGKAVRVENYLRDLRILNVLDLG